MFVLLVGVDKMHKLMPEIVSTAERMDIAPHVKDGYIMMFIYMPGVFPDEFLQYIGQVRTRPLSTCLPLRPSCCNVASHSPTNHSLFLFPPHGSGWKQRRPSLSRCPISYPSNTTSPNLQTPLCPAILYCFIVTSTGTVLKFDIKLQYPNVWIVFFIVIYAVLLLRMN